MHLEIEQSHKDITVCAVSLLLYFMENSTVKVKMKYGLQNIFIGVARAQRLLRVFPRT